MVLAEEGTELCEASPSKPEATAKDPYTESDLDTFVRARQTVALCPSLALFEVAQFGPYACREKRRKCA
jgi:hypothetical protein